MFVMFLSCYQEREITLFCSSPVFIQLHSGCHVLLYHFCAEDSSAKNDNDESAGCRRKITFYDGIIGGGFDWWCLRNISKPSLCTPIRNLIILPLYWKTHKARLRTISFPPPQQKPKVSALNFFYCKPKSGWRMAKSDLFKSSTPHASIKLTQNPNDDFLSSSFFNGLLSAPGYSTSSRLKR